MLLKIALQKNQSLLSWLMLILLFFAQYYQFTTYLHREIIHFYPANYDQASFLPYVYSLYENIKQNGLFSILHRSSILPTGILFPINAMISFLFLGAARFSALLPNFVYYILLQLTAFITVTKLSGQKAFGFMFVGLILSLNTPFCVGGIADFRMDFIALCLYGIISLLVIQSDIFHSRKGTVLITLLVSVMILMRFITLFYFSLLAFVLFAYYAVLYFYSKEIAIKSMAKTRCFHLMLCGVVLFFFLLPDLILIKSALYQYYFIGHLKGVELPFRLTPKTETWFSYYPDMIRDIHIGKRGMLLFKTLLYFYGFLYFIYIISFFFKNPKRSSSPVSKEIMVFLILSTLCPIIILSADPSKSGVVGGIVDIPFLGLIIFFCIYVDNRLRLIFKTSWVDGILKTITLGILIMGFAYQWQSFNIKSSSAHLKELATLNQMYQDIANYANQQKWPVIHLSLDYVSDYLNTGSFSTLYYEKYGKLIKLSQERLGNLLFYPITEAESIDSLKASNVIILSMDPYPTDTFFPGNTSILPFRSHLFNYANAHFHVLGNYEFLGVKRRVYVG